MSNPAAVSVISRFRPMNELEKNNGRDEVAAFDSPTSLTFHSSREKNVYRFNFDRIFPPESTQQEVYDFGVKGIIDSVLEGFNGTVLNYGQTGSGKTYTMQGIMSDEKTQGIIPRMIRHVFNHIYNSDGIDFMLKVSMVEIYQEKIKDLIDTSRINLSIREDNLKGIYIEGVSENYVGCPADVENIMEIGSSNRAQAATNMNEHSSRSHSIFILTITQTNKKEGFSKTGKLYLVDLAGSEKISKTGCSGHTLEEAKIINKSLTTLGRVINNLTDGKSTHIPYRESKLTRVLQESLGGNSKTCLIITCSPAVFNEAETLSTLRFGERAKKMKNKPKINKEITVAELQKLVARLKEDLKKANARITQLENYIKLNGLKIPEGNYNPETEEEEKKKEKEVAPENLAERLKDEEKLIVELKKKYDSENNSVNEKLVNILKSIKSLEESDDIFENRIEIEAQLRSIKDSLDKKTQEDNNKVKSLQDELTYANELKGKLQTALIEKSKDPDQKKLPLLNGKGDVNIDIKQDSNMTSTVSEMKEGIKKLMEFGEIKNNQEITNLLKKLNENVTYVGDLDIGQTVKEIIKKISNRDLTIENIKQPEFLKTKKMVESKEIQTEKSVSEIDKLKEKFENEKKILYKAIDMKTENMKELENEIADLEDRNKALEERIPIKDRRDVEKNLTLEKNLKELRKKLEDSQVNRLKSENLNKEFQKTLIEKNELISNMEKQIDELRDKIGKGNVSNNIVNNMVRVIAGGQTNQKILFNSQLNK